MSTNKPEATNYYAPVFSEDELLMVQYALRDVLLNHGPDFSRGGWSDIVKAYIKVRKAFRSYYPQSVRQPTHPAD